ncbi:MAG: adenine phosphoribosyltransferase [Nocardioidaceae bacterium]
MTAAQAELDTLLTTLIRDVPDFPEPGVIFKDIAPLLADHAGFTAVVEALAEVGRAGEPSVGDDGEAVSGTVDRVGRTTSATGITRVDKVIGIEARGFILAAPVALALGTGFVPVRKAGKLPGATYTKSYTLEYGEATIEVQQDALNAGDRVLIVDDVLATGGTVEATASLVTKAGATVVGVAVLLELGFLAGRDRLADLPLHALMTV